MHQSILDNLASLILRDREAILARWREQVRELPSAKNLDTPTLNDHIPTLLEELASALRIRDAESIPQALQEGSPPAHGLQRVKDGFDIVEVVAEYNILRGCVHDLADRNGLNLQGKPFHIINKVLDGAIGLAVRTYATQQALEVRLRREEYLAFVAHDLRNPLNAISLSARVLELAASRFGISAESTKMFHSLRRNVARLEELVSKVIEENANLKTEIGMKLERRSQDLWPIVESLIHDLHPVAGTASTELVNEVPEDLVVFADAGLLRRILQNLIANAIKYTPRGKVVIGAVARDGGVECSVADDGEGMPSELVEKCFEKGETDPRSEGGLGLGLAIVKTFAEAHGGGVMVQSALGVGTVFRFTLPAR